MVARLIRTTWFRSIGATLIEVLDDPKDPPAPPTTAQRLCGSTGPSFYLASRPQAISLGQKGFRGFGLLGGNGGYFFLHERGVFHCRPYLAARRAMN